MQTLKKIPQDKAVIILRAPTHPSFTFTSRFLYEQGSSL